jgi:hypothetical protein
VCGKEFYFIFWHISNVIEVNDVLESLHANKYAETLIQTVSERFSRTTDLNVIFICCLVTPAGKSIIALLGGQAGSQQAWKQCGNRASIHWPRCFFIMLLKWSCSSRINYIIRVSSTQWKTSIRTTRNLFSLPASKSTLIYCWSCENDRSVSRNRMRMRKTVLSITYFDRRFPTPNVGPYYCRSVDDQNKNHMARRCVD